MSLTSQIITAEFPDLDKVEALNREAFPEEERVPISEFLRYTNDEQSHFFAFYNEEEFVGFAFEIYRENRFYLSYLPSTHRHTSTSPLSQISQRTSSQSWLWRRNHP